MKKHVIVFLVMLISSLCVAQNEVRKNQYYLNNQIINPSNVFYSEYCNMKNKVSISSDLKANGILQYNHFVSGFKRPNKGYTVNLMNEERRKEGQFNYIKSFYKLNLFDSTRNSLTFSPSLGLNFIYDNEKLKLDQTYSFSLKNGGLVFDNYPSKNWLFQFSANNVWSKDRLLFGSLNYSVFDNTSVHSKKGALVHRKLFNWIKVDVVSAVLYDEKIRGDFGSKVMLGREKLEFQYSFRTDKSHIVSTKVRLWKLLLGTNYIISPDDVNEFSFSVAFDFSRQVFMCKKIT